MSVLIKGMTMPKSCRQCSLYLQSMDSERNVYENCAVNAKSYNWGLSERPSDCPLVPISPHGRLIDADAFERDNQYFWNRDFINPKYEDTLADLINAAPTVIEAEREE